MVKMYKIEIVFADPELPNAIHYVKCDNIREAENRLYRMIAAFKIEGIIQLRISLQMSDCLPDPLEEAV